MLQVSESVPLVDSLRHAYECELNVQAQYTAYAEKADGEGWHGVASLFRAAARAEEIHAGNHGRILHLMGGSAMACYRPITVRTTLENLRDAFAGECYEINEMYPAAAAQALICGDTVVGRTFTWALQAEKTHARLFDETIDLLEMDDEDSWVTMACTFFVCPVCGYTSEGKDEVTMCPVCRCAWKKFEVRR